MTDMLNLTAAIAKVSWAARLRAAGSVMDAAGIVGSDLSLLDIGGGFVVDVTTPDGPFTREISIEELVAIIAAPRTDRSAP